MRAGSAHLSRSCIAIALAVLLMGAARVLAGGDHAPPAPLRSVVTEESLHLFGPNVMDSIEPIDTLDPSDAFHADGLRASTCCPMGGFVNVFSFTRFFLGNVFSTMTNEKLTEFTMELNFTTASPITLTFVVYRFNRTTSLYEPQLIVNRSVTGTGRKFYSSGLININLTPDVGGMGQTIPSFYAIGVGWNGTTSILWGRDNNPNGYPMTGCLNTIEGSWGFNSAPPPPGSTTSLPIATLFDDGVVSMQICIEDPPGACCLPGNTCALTLDAAACISQGGTFTAAGVQCNDITCPLPQARCCVGDSCSFVNEFICEAQMGDFQPGQDCLSPFPCGDPRGACCLYEGGCADDLTQIQCAAMDGIFKGDWSVCAAVEQTCEGQGACCRPAVGCDDGTPANPMTGTRCAVEQGTFKGVGSRCADGPADPDPCDVTTTGACCMYDGTCIPDIPQFECVVDLEGGTPGVWFEEQTCGQANCKEMGACCDGLICEDTDSNGCPLCDVESNGICEVPSGLIWYKGAPCQFQPCQSAGQVGACCVLGDCIIASEFTCIDMLDGVFSPAATNAFAACDSGGFVAEVTLDVQECLAGPGVVYTNSECVVFDPNLDLDVDLHDVALLDAAGDPLMDVLVSSSSFSGQCSAINGNEGACCVGGQCMVTSSGFCPGTFLGTGVACSSEFQCSETACCNYQGVEGCTTTTYVQCVSDPSGTPSQPGLSCSDFPDPCAPDGSCCLPAGGCEFFTQAECDLEGGIWTEGQSCQAANCPTAGACCLDDGGCESLIPDACANLDGVFQGDGVSCAQANCPQPGACCMTDGSCSVMLEEDCQANPDNVFQGEGVVCSNGLCPQPGACCQNLGQPVGFVCSEMLESDCEAANPPGQFAGELTLCINDACDIGSCCELDGGCDEVFRTSCAFLVQGGLFADGGTCEPNPCVPRGACCINGGASCQVLSGGDCLVAGGVYQGDATLCGGDVCTLTGCCENGVCTDRFPANCLDMGGVPGEPNQTCNTGNLCADGACCIDFGSGFSCFTGLNQLECQAAGDNFEGSGFVGVGATCTGDPCSDLCPSVVGVGIGDFDNDGDVDLRDFNEFSQCFGPSPGAECLCIFDSNQNGVIDLMDYEAFVAEFLGP